MLLNLRKSRLFQNRLNCRIYSNETLKYLNKQLPALAYQPELVEKDKYETWQNNKLFTPDPDSKKPKFSMVLPPPNVTGDLHLGHALGCTIQDVILRRKRSLGYNVLWVPGIDHAGIATQGVVEKYLENTHKINRHILGRRVFNKEVWKWTKMKEEKITKQLQILGFSLDWSRKTFTMDPKHNEAVKNAFINLFNDGLIYRKKALVNWCNALKSTVSDIEVDNIEINGETLLKIPEYPEPVQFGRLYNISYRIFGSNTGEEIVVSTTMPETMLGDVAVAVHPNDPRYGHLAGKRVYHPFKKSTLPIIYDSFVDKDFGTGAVKITPAHSKTDYEVALKHKLELHQVIDEDGKIINAGYFTGLQRYKCREKVLEKLKGFNLLREITKHNMTLPVCSRTGDVIYHLPKEQWFIDCKKLNEKAREVVQCAELSIHPSKYIKNWFDWANDDRDWCISRQLWWGHQIPAYKCTTTDKKELWVAADNEDNARIQAANILDFDLGGITVERDQDVLDTWFSSGIYPFACLGWGPDNNDIDFYPLDLMATGHDILGFWVHRMVMLGLQLTDKVPFNSVLLHGIICDSKGAKMSKSKGNVIDPLDVIKGISMEKLKEKAEAMHKTGILSKAELKKALAYHKANFSQTSGIPECGVDALRFTLLSHDVKSHFVNFDVHMCHANKLFCNKIWQSLKYIQRSCFNLPTSVGQIAHNDLSQFDRWILSRLAFMVQRVNNSMDVYDFHLATKALKNHIHNEFCDVYLEATKPGFKTSSKVRLAHAHTLTAALNTSLRCLNPFMIYLTDELIPKIPEFQHNLIHNFDDLNKPYYKFPLEKDFQNWRDLELEKQIGKVLDTAAMVRELKGLCGMSSSMKPKVCIKTSNSTLQSNIKSNELIVTSLARCCTLNFNDVPQKNFLKGILDNNSEVWIELLGPNVQNTIEIAKAKIKSKIQKLETNLKITRPDLESISQSTENQKMILKWEQFKKMERDLDEVYVEK